MISNMASETRYAGPNRLKCPRLRRPRQIHQVCWQRFEKTASINANCNVWLRRTAVLDTAIPVRALRKIGQHQEPTMKGKPTTVPAAEYQYPVHDRSSGSPFVGGGFGFQLDEEFAKIGWHSARSISWAGMAQDQNRTALPTLATGLRDDHPAVPTLR